MYVAYVYARAPGYGSSREVVTSDHCKAELAKLQQAFPLQAQYVDRDFRLPFHKRQNASRLMTDLLIWQGKVEVAITDVYSLGHNPWPVARQIVRLAPLHVLDYYGSQETFTDVKVLYLCEKAWKDGPRYRQKRLLARREHQKHMGFWTEDFTPVGYRKWKVNAKTRKPKYRLVQGDDYGKWVHRRTLWEEGKITRRQLSEGLGYDRVAKTLKWEQQHDARVASLCVWLDTEPGSLGQGQALPGANGDSSGEAP